MRGGRDSVPGARVPLLLDRKIRTERAGRLRDFFCEG